MKTKKYLWGSNSYELYTPKINRRKQVGLLGIIGVTTLLPGPNIIGLGLTKLISKLNPLWVYQ